MNKYLAVIHHQTMVSKNTRVSHQAHLSAYTMLPLFTFFTVFFSKVFAFTFFTIFTRTLPFLSQVCQKLWSCFWLHDHDFPCVFCQNKPHLDQTGHQFAIHFGKIFQYCTSYAIKREQRRLIAGFYFNNSTFSTGPISNCLINACWN